MYTGTVKWFNTTMGYGFIVRDDGGGDVYVRFNAIIGDEEQRALLAEQRVEFQLTVGENGPEAHEVRGIE
ncbi:MAG: cold shock domain-containing protein [Chloroflexi bacterium]|nr:cold shock domain-containing protein [Chloroflexota bacterium]